MDWQGAERASHPDTRAERVDLLEDAPIRDLPVAGNADRSEYFVRAVAQPMRVRQFELCVTFADDRPPGLLILRAWPSIRKYVPCEIQKNEARGDLGYDV